MGRLAGLNIGRLSNTWKKRGFAFYRQAAGSHEIWFNPETKLFTTIPNHTGDIPEGALHAILRQAGISVDDFLETT